MSSNNAFLSKIWEKRHTIFLLLIIFIIAFIIRGHNLKFDLFFGFDSYYHARMVALLLEQGFLPQFDPLAYYYVGGSPVPTTGLFFWYFSAALYKVFTLNAPYSKELWIQFVKILPALFGSLTAIAMYFFGKELYGKHAGYGMALFSAVVPSFVYRTMAGFFEEDSLGFLWLIIGFTFFFRAMKKLDFSKESLINALLAGIFFGIMSWTWEFFVIVPIIWILYFFFGSINIYAKQGAEKLKPFVGLFAISFLVFTFMTFFSWGFEWISRIFNVTIGNLPLEGGASLFLLLFGLIIFGFFAFILFFGSAKDSVEKRRKSLNLISMILLYAAFGVILMILFDFGGLFSSQFESGTVLGATIGEESFGGTTFGYKYNMLLLFPLLALIIIPFHVFRNKKEHLSVIIFFWIALSLIGAFYKLKFTYLFGLPVAASAGVILNQFFVLWKKRSNTLEVKFIAIFFAFLLIGGVAAGSYFVTKRPPTIETQQNWKNVFEWMKNETPEDATFFNWWDKGHWLTFIGERKASLDNRNYDFQGDSDFARFTIETNETEAFKILKKYKPDYLLFDSTLMQSQTSAIVNGDNISITSPSMFLYAYDTLNLSSVPGLPQKMQGYLAAYLPCGESVNGFNCRGNFLTHDQMENLPTTIAQNPTSLIAGGRLPVFYYREENNSSIAVVGPESNKSMLVRIWFNDPSLSQYFEQVYFKDDIKVFKVKEEFYQ